jgi:hypothetical protein
MSVRRARQKTTAIYNRVSRYEISYPSSSSIQVGHGPPVYSNARSTPAAVCQPRREALSRKESMRSRASRANAFRIFLVRMQKPDNIYPAHGDSSAKAARASGRIIAPPLRPVVVKIGWHDVEVDQRDRRCTNANCSAGYQLETMRHARDTTWYGLVLGTLQSI